MKRTRVWHLLLTLLAVTACAALPAGCQGNDVQAPVDEIEREEPPPSPALIALRKRPPICGVPSVANRKMYVERMQTFTDKTMTAWRDAIYKVTGEAVSRKLLCFRLPIKMAVMYDGGKLKEKVRQRFVKRLNSIPRAEFGKWHQGVQSAVGSRLFPWAVALTLAAVDPLYDQADTYDAKRAKKYLKRLDGLSKRHVGLWMKRIRTYAPIPDDAAISITLNEGFFKDERFDEKAFNDALK